MRIVLPSGTPAEVVRVTDPARGLVIAPDIGGLRPLFDDMVARLSAENGWTVCAVEPFPGDEDTPVDQRLQVLGHREDSRHVGDLLEAADACECEPVGVLGFCMGGMYTLKAAGTGRFDRAVSFYGMIRIPDQWKGPGQGEPLDALSSDVAAPVLAIIGTADIWTPPADVDALEKAGATVVRYEGAEHGFAHDPSRPAHRPDDAADAWTRAVDFLTV